MSKTSLINQVKDPGWDGYLVCTNCGKRVYMRGYSIKNWAYKYHSEFCCSYNCQTQCMGWTTTHKSTEELLNM